jgi:hypothetical protein
MVITITIVTRNHQLLTITSSQQRHSQQYKTNNNNLTLNKLQQYNKKYSRSNSKYANKKL